MSGAADPDHDDATWQAEQDAAREAWLEKFNAHVDTGALSASELTAAAMDDSRWVEKDAKFYERRLKLLRAAIDKGSDEAMVHLGDHYYYPKDDRDPDYVEALKWYTMAADAGNTTTAMMRIGDLHRFGRVTGRADPLTAIAWYNKGIATNCSLCLFRYGCMVFEGEGVLKDEDKAAEIFTKAANLGDGNSMVLLGELAEKRDDMELSFQWYKKAADAGNAEGLVKTGKYYQDGKGVKQDKKEAAHYFFMAAELGDAEGHFQLACCFGNGEGEDKDDRQALARFIMAAELGHASACFYVGELFNAGQGAPQSRSTALKYYLRAAELGDEEAAARVAEFARAPKQGRAVASKGKKGWLRKKR